MAETVKPQLNDMQQMMSFFLRELNKNDDNRREMERLMAEGFAQVRVRQERHHKEQLHAIQSLTAEVQRLIVVAGDAALHADTYSHQAVRMLEALNREICRLPAVVASLADLTAAPAEEQPAPLVLMRRTG